MADALSEFLLNSSKGNVMLKFSLNILKSLITEEERGVEEKKKEEEEERRREGKARWGGRGGIK